MGVGGKQKDNTDRRRIRKGSERTAQKREGRLMRRRRGETSKSHNNGLEERERERALPGSSSSCKYVLISASTCLEMTNVHLLRTLNSPDFTLSDIYRGKAVRQLMEEGSG